MRTARRILGVALGAGLLAGSLVACSAEEPPQPKPAGSWTVLSYSIADTDLEPFMMDDITEMGDVGTQDDLNIVALVDRADGYTNDAVLGIDGWTGAKVLEITPGAATELDDLGDINTGDPAVLADFVARGIAEYPADNYALIISDHGASWPGVGGDESSDNDGLTLDEINQGITRGLADAKVDRLDLLGFDACLMATYEVAATLAPRADRLLASQELEPGHGWNYTALQTVVDNGGATADQLGEALIDGFSEQADEEETKAEITLSLIDLTRFTLVEEALDGFAGQLRERASTVAPVVGRSLAAALGFGRSPDPEQDTHMTDLGILAGEIGVDALDISDAADDLVRAINDVVLDRVDGQATKGATGLSIYFPPTAEYFDENYRSLPAADNWMGFLDEYYGVGAAIPAENQPAFDTRDGEATFDDDGLTITASFDSRAQEGLTDATIRYGIVGDDGSVQFLGEEPAEIAEDGSSSASGTWDLTKLVISDGEDTVDAYLGLSNGESDDELVIDVPMAYYSAEDVDGETYQDALLSLVFGGDPIDLLSETYYSYNEDLGTYGELSAEAEGIIVPEVLTVDGEGAEEWTATSDTGLYADLPELSYDLADVPAGTTVYIELTVTDFGGNTDTASATAVVPAR